MHLLVLGLAVACRQPPEVVTPVTGLVTLGSLYQAPPGPEAALAVGSSLLTAGPGEALTYGHVWSATHDAPTLADAKTEFRGPVPSLPHLFRSVLPDPAPGQSYFVRAYAANKAGVVYSPAVRVSPGKSLPAALGAILHDSLRTRDVGFAFVIYEGDQLKAFASGGPQSRTTDPEGASPYTIHTKMHVASMSKTITALAFLHLAARNGLKTTDRIAPYLPAAWPKGEHVEAITFRDLLTHHSGLAGAGGACRNGTYSENTYAGLKSLVALGVKPENRGNYCYQNANLGLFRVLIPALSGYTFTGDDAVDDPNTQARYAEAVRQNVFERAGIAGAVTGPPAGTPAYAYTFPHGGGAGWNPGGFAATAGGYGWYLTAAEAGKLFATTLSGPGESVLPAAWKDTLLTRELGCFTGVTGGGTVYLHDGRWYRNADDYRGLRTIWMKYPGNLTIVLFVNALDRERGLFPSGDGTDIVRYVNRAYAQARQAAGGRLTGATLHLKHPEPH